MEAMTLEEWELLRGEPMTPDGLVLFARDLGTAVMVEGHGDGTTIRPVHEGGLRAATDAAVARMGTTGGFSTVRPDERLPLHPFTASGLPGYVPRPLAVMAYPDDTPEPRYLPDGSSNAGTLPPEPAVLDMNLASFVGGTGRHRDRADGTRERLAEVALADGTQYLIDGDGLALVMAARPDLEPLDWTEYDRNGREEQEG